MSLNSFYAKMAKLYFQILQLVSHGLSHTVTFALTMSLMGLSSSMSMGTLVLWIQVLVHRCLSRTYEFLEDKRLILCPLLLY